ncbi:VCBS repeat-containing protein [Flavihumibacter sp. CACIAM 22H1]|uniref:VCBS repeat-containing protein n=1 Tax=Flavihumibacter sp. CACIAM 22H1 TaxID=1812911 RepID=UPI0007A83702|nr:VCBS repeat-containing protein [Flavihumibacter sp. CACIAM 22H1]KYP16415.1 MAG: RNA-binding protein [Flavihumibacter sp. CACIAM 22H1]
MKLLLYIPLLLCLLCLPSCKEQESQTKPTETNQLFSLLPAEQTGIAFENSLTEGLNTNILLYEYFYNGAGIATGDFNNDGLVDLYFSSNMGENKFYLNKGNWTFEDITLASMAGGRSGPWKSGVNAVDINGDGRLDIYLCYSGAMPAEKRKNQLFINKGNSPAGIPQFDEQAAAYGLAHTGFSNQSYFFDYDLDGDLDMLLMNHNPKNLPILNAVQTKQLLQQDDPEKGIRLFRQDAGKFEDITVEAGINGSELCYGLGIGIADFNRDGWADFYVSNDYAVPDFLYINNKKGGFSNQLEASMGHISQFSMGNDVADINNDGHTDLFTLDMLPEDNRRQKLLMAPDNYEKFSINLNNGFYYQYMRNMLQLNNGNGSFSEIGQQAGVSNTDWSWSALLADFDNDGWKDLHITNGYLKDFTNLDFIHYMNEYIQQKGRLQREDVMTIIKEMPSSNVMNYMFHNTGETSFTNTTEAWGLNRVSNSNGAAYADLDNDGDLDLVVNNINQPAFIYKNTSAEKKLNNYLQVKLVGEAPNTQGIGAKLELYKDGQVQLQEQYPARGYLSNVSFIQHFGTGSHTVSDSLIITWSSGKVQRFEQLPSNQTLVVEEKNAGKATSKTVFVTPWLKVTENPVSIPFSDSNINDFNRQSLLLHQFSNDLVCLEKADINKDGKQDLLVGGAKGIATSLYLQQSNGQFVKQVVPAFEADKLYQDAAIAVFDANGDGYADIYIASGGYHSLDTADILLQDRLYINNGKNQFTRSAGLPDFRSASSCIAVDDINADGAPDLFVGGRVVPGRYPEPPRSTLLLNDGRGNFQIATQKIAPALERIGMVTDAVWADLNGDKKNELILAGEWMPIRIFQNENGQLADRTEVFLPDAPTGFWNVVEVADFNADGKPDLVAGNLGLNSQIRASEKEPATLHFADFDKNGSIDPIFSFYIQGKSYPYVTRDELIGQLPSMRKRFSTFKSYSTISLDELFTGNELNTAGKLTATETATLLFLSGPDGKLTKVPLPQQVQCSPVYAIHSFDFNGDGKLDLLLAGNTSQAKIRLGKMDANYGTLLQGDGKGQFKWIPPLESGLELKGEIRSVLALNDKLLFGIARSPLKTYRFNKQKK